MSFESMGQENLPEELESKAASEKNIEEYSDINLSDKQQEELRNTLRKLGVSNRE